METTNDLAGDFKSAMRRLASTVTIVSARSGAERFGMAATAVTSLTSDPPSLLACVNKSAGIHQPIIESGKYCVNLLACHHHHLVPTFSGLAKGEQRFALGEWLSDEEGIPYLEGAQAALLCDVVQTISYESHSIFIGSVRSVRMSEDVCPLIYQDGGFFRTVSMMDVPVP